MATHKRGQFSKLELPKFIGSSAKHPQATAATTAYSSNDFWNAVALLRAIVMSGHDEKKLLEAVSREVKKPKFLDE